ncbi:hypothetical protein MKX01_037663 [Papaver californicum]|nr:hypothetical protein MKX01_037663 [Papaver californicum]
MNNTISPVEVEQVRGVLRIYSDGSIVRSIDDDGSVVWKDYVFDSTNNLSLRLYKSISASSSSAKKLSMFCYIHSGGFCIGLTLASHLQALIISPDYRLAPENRISAAIEDANFEQVFISGYSAGGNIAHNIAVCFGADAAELKPIHVRVRSKSEAEGPVEAFLNLELIDRFWRLSIPEEATTDHPLVNPFVPESKVVSLAPILVVVGGTDLLEDRAKYYAEKLKEFGKKAEYVEFEGMQHDFFTINPNSEDSNKLMQIIEHFMLVQCSGSRLVDFGQVSTNATNLLYGQIKNNV